MKKYLPGATVLFLIIIAIAGYVYMNSGNFDGEFPVSRPVVVELFTSQGCSSCPRADMVLGELAGRKDILPLSFHVDYWDRLGWKDVFGSPQNTERQKDYSAALNNNGLLTPQFIIDGEIEVSGAKKRTLYNAIVNSAAQQNDNVPVMLLTSNRKNIRIRIGDDKAYTADTNQQYDIWVVTFHNQKDTLVQSGENHGRLLRSFNVVSEIHHMGYWKGEQQEKTITIDRFLPYDGMVVLIQKPQHNKIVGVLRHDFN